jgi:Fe-S cluster biogenesis protein NfuA
MDPDTFNEAVRKLKRGGWGSEGLALRVGDSSLQPRFPGLYLSSPVKDKNRLEASMKEQVQAVITKLRPMLQRDGGDIELVDVTDGIVKVRLTGACGSCPMSTMTLKMGVENALKKEVPGVKEVVSA